MKEAGLRGRVAGSTARVWAQVPAPLGRQQMEALLPVPSVEDTPVGTTAEILGTSVPGGASALLQCPAPSFHR